MKFIKMDPEYSIFYLLICIVIPPLFIINLILIIIQAIANKIDD